MTCEFASICKYYSAKSFSCHNTARTFNGSFYCGKARQYQLDMQTQNLNSIVELEILYQQTGRTKK